MPASSPSRDWTISVRLAGTSKALRMTSSRGRIDKERPCVLDAAADHDPLGIENIYQAGDRLCPASCPCPASRDRVLVARSARPRRPRLRSTAPSGGLACAAAALPGSSERCPARMHTSRDSPGCRTYTACPRGSSVIWPISPAMPSAPCQMRSSSTMPPPTPVPSVSRIMLLMFFPAPRHCSPKRCGICIVLDHHRQREPSSSSFLSGRLFQSGKLGDLTTTPVSARMTPGAPTPTAATVQASP